MKDLPEVPEGWPGAAPPDEARESDQALLAEWIAEWRRSGFAPDSRLAERLGLLERLAAPRADPGETILKIREIAFDYLHGNGDGWRVVKQIHELADALAAQRANPPSEEQKYTKTYLRGDKVQNNAPYNQGETDAARAEREARIRIVYQDIVYAVCNVLDREPYLFARGGVRLVATKERVIEALELALVAARAPGREP